MPIDPHKANIVIYRVKQFAGSAVLTPIYINGKKKSPMLSNGSFQTLTLDPGKYIFHTEPGNWMTPIARRTEVSLAAGEKYFMRFKIDNYQVVMFAKFELVEKEQALVEIKNMRLSLEK